MFWVFEDRDAGCKQPASLADHFLNAAQGLRRIPATTR